MSWLAFLEQNALRGTIVLTVALAAASASRHASAALRSLVWTSACAALLALPVALLVVPKWSPAPALAVARPVDGAGQALPPTGSGGDAWQARVDSSTPVPQAPRFDWLAKLWTLGCAAAAAWFALGFWRASRMVRRARPAGYARAALDNAMLALGIRRPARVLETGVAPMPLAWGLLNPVVILPSGAHEWPEERLRAVLLHELVHAQRLDLAAQAVVQAAFCLYWFHPLAWLAARQFRKERERACDDAVLRHMAGPAYAGHLMELARGMAARRMRWAGAPAMAQPSDLESRVRALLDRRRDRRPLTRRAALAAAAIACVVLLPAASIGARAQAVPTESPSAVASPVAAPSPVAKPAPEPVAAVGVTEVSADPEPAAATAPEPQSASGLLFGVVRDPSLAVVPNCRVSARNLDGSDTENTVTNAVGEYRIPSIPPGRYALEFRAAGFLIARQEAVVAAGLSTQASVNLEVGHVAEMIIVTAPRPGAAAPQSSSGVLHGFVREPGLAAVPNCRVSARNLDGSNTVAAVTNAAGEYRIPGVSPGRYALEFQAAGFSIARNEVVVAAGLSTEDSVNLEIAPVVESISVTASRPLGAAPVAAGAEAQRIRVGGNVQPLSLIRRVNPAYPADLKLAGIEGKVVVRAIISKEGDVLNPQAASADVHPRLVEAAIDAVRQWKYRPTLLNGQPIETLTEIEVVFSLQ